MDASAFKEFEAAGWAERARSYDLVTGAVTRRAATALLDAAGVGAGSRVLDVGAGTGTLAGAAAGRGAEVTGVDLAAGMRELARERFPAAEFLEGDAENLPFEAGSFDALVAGFVLNHLTGPEAALAEWARVLRPGGALAAAVWERPPGSRLMSLLGDAIRGAGLEPAAGVPPGPDPFRFADDGELEALLAGAGLERVTVETIALEHETADLDSLWEGLLGGSVRGSSAVLAQNDADRARVRAEFDRLVSELWHDGRYRIPAAVRVGAARRASG